MSPTVLPPEPPPPAALPTTVYTPGDPVALTPEQLIEPPGPFADANMQASDPAAGPGGVTIQSLRHVCANDLTVRYCPLGASFGYLRRDDPFNVERYSGRWAYGTAYGCVNAKGWVDSCWLYGGAPGGTKCCG